MAKIARGALKAQEAAASVVRFETRLNEQMQLEGGGLSDLGMEGDPGAIVVHARARAAILEVWCVAQLNAFARSMCCRARNTVRSPAFTSADTVHSRNATLRGSMRSADQNVSSPIRCCLAWQAVHRGTA